MLEDPSVNRSKAQLRAVALQILGEAYMGVKKNEDGSAMINHEESEYVRVETKNSRQRESQAYNTAPAQPQATA